MANFLLGFDLRLWNHVAKMFVILLFQKLNCNKLSRQVCLYGNNQSSKLPILNLRDVFRMPSILEAIKNQSFRFCKFKDFRIF